MMNLLNMTKEPPMKVLSLQVRTWSRDSHGLYDYECQQTKLNNYQIRKEQKIIRKKNDVRLEALNYMEDKEEEYLGTITVDQQGNFFITNPITYRMNPNEENINNLQNKVWYIIRCEDIQNNANPQNQNLLNENDFAELKLNDIIKLGRVKYAVTELKINNVKTSIDMANPESQVFNLIPEYSKNSSTNMEGVICKICLVGNEDEENPLINLCRCSGSMEFIHYTCVKLWMNTKLNNKENEKKTVLSYNMKSFNCEICKTPYPLRFRYNEKYFEIISCTRPVNNNYIVLESLNQLKDNNNYKSIHVITLNEGDKIIMGRGHDSDVRINDISVSRTHSCLVLNNKKVLLKDLKSKFGTLILVQGELEITNERKLSLQIGRSYFEACFPNNKEIKTKEKNLAAQNAVKLNLSNTTTKKQIFQVEKCEKNNVPRNRDDMDLD